MNQSGLQQTNICASRDKMISSLSGFDKRLTPFLRIYHRFSNLISL